MLGGPSNAVQLGLSWTAPRVRQADTCPNLPRTTRMARRRNPTETVCWIGSRTTQCVKNPNIIPFEAGVHVSRICRTAEKPTGHHRSHFATRSRKNCRRASAYGVTTAARPEPTKRAKKVIVAGAGIAGLSWTYE